MANTELEKYILEQAKTEVEHTRSWPAKIMAFYVAINFGILASVAIHQTELSCWWKTVISIIMVALFVWSVFLLTRNHRSYLVHRNIQIQYQINHRAELPEGYSFPEDWFRLNKVSIFTRLHGWGFYCFIMFLVIGLTLSRIWIIN
jgi:hypothetical protein